MEYGTRVRETITDAGYTGKVIVVADYKAKVLLDTRNERNADSSLVEHSREYELYHASWFFIEDLEIIEEVPEL